MRGLFVDTAGWVACADQSDPDHEQSAAARDEWLAAGGLFVTTDYIVDETLALLRLRLGLKVAQSWWNLVNASPRIRWEIIDSSRADSARAIFFGFGDKTFSFTDCTSFAVMRELKLSEALTTDQHFVQMGFVKRP